MGGGVFPGGSDGKESACNAADQGLIPGLGRSLERGHGDLFQYSCLENSMDRGAWWATVHVVAESDTTEETNTFTFTFNHCIGGWVLNHWTTRVVTVCHFLNFCFKMLYKSNHNSTLFGLAFSLSIVPRRFIQVLVCVFWVTAHVCTSLLNYSLVDKVVSRFLLLLTMLLWTFMYRFLCKCNFSFLRDKCPGMQMLSYTEVAF